MKDFTRTLQTAADAQAISALLRRAATDARAIQDKIKLGELSDRYAEYARALRETVALPQDGPEPDQPALL